MSARYDADFGAIFGGPDRGDLAFFCGLAAEARGPICEVGAGTGRVAWAVAEAVPDALVSAVEPSAGMRQVLTKRIARAADPVPRITPLDGHFAALPLQTGTQALVYSAFRSFQHVLSPAAQLDGLAEMRRVLAPGGVLAIDLFDPNYALLHTAEPVCVATYAAPEGAVVERWDGRTVDRVTQTVQVHFRWITRDRGGRIVADERDDYTIRYTFPHELLHVAARAGLRDVTLYGDYDRRPLAPEPRELVLIAR